MSSINSINNSIAISFYKSDELSATTKMRLEALGIDPSTVTSEAQAQILIAQAEAAPRQNNSGHQQGGNSSQHQLIFEAKELASKVGAAVSDLDNLEDMISKISERINVLGQNPNTAKEAQCYQRDLADLAQRANVIVITQQNIFNTMDMISISNKLLLGLQHY